MRIARRMGAIPPYVFAEVASRIAQQEARGRPVLNLGPGSPDLPPPGWIVEAMVAATAEPANHRYPGYRGTAALRRSWAHYYARRFGVTLDPEREILPLIGSKEGVAHIALALVDPGDLVLVPNPGYPAYAMGTILAGGAPYPMRLDKENGFLPDLDAIPTDVLDRAVAMWLNYPNNPTGAVAPRDFYERAVALAHRHGFALLSDNPYAEITFDDYRAPSLLEIEGADAVALEFNSLSKTYNMAGWRIGAAVGNPTLVDALLRVKSNIDTGLFLPLQSGAVAALDGEQEWIVERNRIYQRRRDVAVEGLRAAGFSVDRPAASLYVWAEVPEGMSARHLALRFLEEADVWITPGEAFGDAGARFMRLALCSPEEAIGAALERVATVMRGG